MSHASLLVVLELIDPTDKLELATALQFQLAPYDENNECFRDGSRWDWYEIGGRFSGELGGEDIVKVSDLELAVFKPTYAFLRNRHWHEPERLGWFCCTAKSECEKKANDNPDIIFNRCFTTGDENAKIVTWNEPWEVWEKEFIPRFIFNLTEKHTLVIVDYHV